VDFDFGIISPFRIYEQRVRILDADINSTSMTRPHGMLRFVADVAHSQESGRTTCGLRPKYAPGKGQPAIK
jgi:hypothetical protein